ncbi:hypothetical protein SUGI_0088210 [Cryptomeria japonica]|uniref:ABC transporter G family member 29 isoform X2 n=1 Tax=Cryptomeria japonica TaxID=3369 RepID=UPI002408EBF5|nr:ABC transporter G family member 29 isoform X2 [Cryptomeria japonica]GLJ08411.1 hypothetical protein SUGI_0088210 [Cryptomeria japonica]
MGTSVARNVSLRSSSRRNNRGIADAFIRSTEDSVEDDEQNLMWAAIEKLPTYNRLRTSILFQSDTQNGHVDAIVAGKTQIPKEVDVRKLEPMERKMFIEKVLQVTEEDNEKFLKKLRARIDKVGIEIPTIEVRFENLSVQGKCFVGGRALPTLWNSAKNFIEALLGSIGLSPTKKVDLQILKDVTGIIKPSRLTLLLGPPSSGKTTLLLSLANKVAKDLKVKGSITYNGHGLDEFVPQKTSAYISQNDLHVGLMTVRETLDFSARCQGVGSRYELLSEVARREKEGGIFPEPEVDLFMKATAMGGVRSSLQTDYTLKMLGLDNCGDTMIGDQMLRGISGGERKRVTTGEMIVGPTRALFMDEISTGLDTTTAYQIVKCLQQICSHMDATILMSLLQPAPEIYELFDDIILLSEGQIVYHGPREHVLEFFDTCGFQCPERKSPADFLQEVTSAKDQQQYWANKTTPYRFVSVKEFANMFKTFHVGSYLSNELSIPYDKQKNHKAALVLNRHSVPKTEIFKACFEREWLLFKRNSFFYIFKTVQIIFMAVVATTVFLRTRMRQRNEDDGSLYLGALFFSLLVNMFNGAAELSYTLSRLPMFFKQRDLLLFPAWAYTIPTLLLSIPISVVEGFSWVIVTYYGIGFSPEASRFFRQFLILTLVNQMSASLFRLLAAICRTKPVSNSLSNFALLSIFMLGGFVIPREKIPKWWTWGYWSSPMMYGQNALVVNEMLAPRWNKSINGNLILGLEVLKSRQIFQRGYWYWIGAAALLGFILVFNILYTMVLTYINPPGKPQPVLSRESIAKQQGAQYDNMAHKEPQVFSSWAKDKKLEHFSSKDSESNASKTDLEAAASGSPKQGMILPFKPLTMSFSDVNYFVDMPQEMTQQGVTDKRLQLLQDVTGVFRPGVLTALMGISGAGKTTLMDVLAGRKTSGYIEGDIRISGFPKRQETFARISGYCEQNDIHSPQLTVRESLIFSAFIRLPREVDKMTKLTFVEEIMQLVELDDLRDALVGLPGVTGLSTEQRKRLTIAIELVANPSIIFMDEPTSGLDARAAAIVMRTVRNTVNTGRTVVCTIHQPSIDIFESFDELLLMKRGGQIIFAGTLGQNSHKIIEYFESVPGIPKIKYKCNPATWMLEVSSAASELRLGIDFAEHYKNSCLYEKNKALIKELSIPVPDAKDLCYPMQYSQSFCDQFKFCLWKQWWTYWRSPPYNSVRYVVTLFTALVFGTLFWDYGKKMDNGTDLFVIIGGSYGAVMFLGVSNSLTVQPVVAIERTVFYRERAAGMYSAMPYALAQVAIEIPYILSQTVLYALIVYSMIGFQWVASKFAWFLFIYFFTFLYFTYYGMMAISITPNEQMAAILTGSFGAIFNLFSGFFIPKPKIPKWWIWYYWICPVAWTVYGLIITQYGDITNPIMVNGKETMPLNKFVEEYFGYSNEYLWPAAVVLIGFGVFFAIMFGMGIKVLNFQKR